MVSDGVTGMASENRQKTTAASRWLVRGWFGSVGLAALVLTGMLVDDYFRGEGLSHLGLPFMLALASIVLLAVAVALLPLLIIAVFRDRREKA